MNLNVFHTNKLLKTRSIEGTLATIGSGADCELPLDFPTVSKVHCKITREAGVFLVSDCGSKNGTRIKRNGKWFDIPVGPPVKFHPDRGDRLGIAPYEITLDIAAIDLQKKFDLYSTAKKYLGLLKKNRLNPLEELRESVTDENVIEKIFHEFHGNGPVEKFLNNAACKEILINRYDRIFVDTGRGLEPSADKFISEESFHSWAYRIATQVGRRLDLQNPICEATLKDGSRFHAVLPPVSASGLSVSIRRFGTAPVDEETALTTGWMSHLQLEVLKRLVNKKVNIVISGGTSTGKTSLLNFVCGYFDLNERIITIEDTIELKLVLANQVQLQARKPNADGVGEIALRTLVQSALRMRPDRIIVGECRGDEVIEMLQALNTGHPGSLTTVHANSCKDAMERIELLAMLGAPNLSAESIKRWIQSSVECVIQVERSSTGKRFIKEIAISRKGAEKAGISLEASDADVTMLA